MTSEILTSIPINCAKLMWSLTYNACQNHFTSHLNMIYISWSNDNCFCIYNVEKKCANLHKHLHIFICKYSVKWNETTKHAESCKSIHIATTLLHSAHTLELTRKYIISVIECKRFDLCENAFNISLFILSIAYACRMGSSVCRTINRISVSMERLGLIS